MPCKASIACARLPSVALMPHTSKLGFKCLSRASASCNCTPRLLPISSCHSSTTTACTLANSSFACVRDSIRLSDSGVVSSVVGQRVLWRALSALLVSPVRMPSVQSGARSASGSCSARRESVASARIGVIHNTVSGGAAWRFLTADAGTDVAAAMAGFIGLRSLAGRLTAKRCNNPNHTA